MVAIDIVDIDFADDMDRDLTFLLVLVGFMLLVLLGILYVNGHVMKALFKLKHTMETRKTKHRSNFGERARFARQGEHLHHISNPNVRFFVDPEDAEKFQLPHRQRDGRRASRHAAHWTTEVYTFFHRPTEATEHVEMSKAARVQTQDGRVKYVTDWV